MCGRSRFAPGLPALTTASASGPGSPRAVKGRRRKGMAGLAVAAVLMSLTGGCSGSGDPAFEAFVRNDTRSTVAVYFCNTTCSAGQSRRAVLRPGQSAPEVANGEDIDNYYIVRRLDGKVVGCLDLRFSSDRPGIRIPISAAVSCAHQTDPYTPLGQSLLFLLALGGALVALAGATTLGAFWLSRLARRGGPS